MLDALGVIRDMLKAAIELDHEPLIMISGTAMEGGGYDFSMVVSEGLSNEDVKVILEKFIEGIDRVSFDLERN